VKKGRQGGSKVNDRWRVHKKIETGISSIALTRSRREQCTNKRTKSSAKKQHTFCKKKGGKVVKNLPSTKLTKPERRDKNRGRDTKQINEDVNKKTKKKKRGS